MKTRIDSRAQVPERHGTGAHSQQLKLDLDIGTTVDGPDYGPQRAIVISCNTIISGWQHMQKALSQFGYYEFFSGGGMARLGLGRAWRCMFANDFDKTKASSYRANFCGAPELVEQDVRDLRTEQLPSNATLAWASFPCQDLSLAGAGAGLGGKRSGVFWAFWNLLLSLKNEHRNPPLVVLENVAGLVTSHSGEDLRNLITALVRGGYRAGALLLDAAHFVPQSRPRLFIIAVARDVMVPDHLERKSPHPLWHTGKLQTAIAELPTDIRREWIWWNLPIPNAHRHSLSELIETSPTDVRWHSKAETEKLLDMMTPANLEKVRRAELSGIRQVGTVYKRTRSNIQRAEVRFDGLSGCLRTPSGGSSRQIIIEVDGHHVRTRLISARETARLMGLPDDYTLPDRYNDAYHLTGDGVVVPAVSWLESNLLRPIAEGVSQLTANSEEQESILVQTRDHSVLAA